jgi:D-serine deaminase-like pyridoxal phosphate-dependent protein
MHISELDTPALILDLDIMERNIASMAAYSAQAKVSLRPHIKTHKIPRIAQRQIDAGAIGITSAKHSEAAVMVAEDIRDILIAYPIVSAAKADALASLVAEGASITVSLDSETSARCLSEAAGRSGQHFTLLVEIDVGFGRCGLATSGLALSLARLIDTLPGVTFGGLMYYPGHIFAQGPDQEAKIVDVNRRVDAAWDALTSAGFTITTVSGGSSPTARRATDFHHITEIRPGMYPFNDRNLLEAGYATLGDCALRVLATVVSTAVSGHAVLDTGSKTLSSDRLLTGDKIGFGLVVEDPTASLFGLSEEHGHLDIAHSEKKYTVGERLTVIPNHVCTTINMHNSLYAVRNGAVEDIWQIPGRGCVR